MEQAVFEKITNMRIFREIPPKEEFQNPVLAIGSFDGVHSGHRRILSTLLNIAHKKSGEGIVLTFSNHPRKVLTPKTPPRILTTIEEKIQAIDQYGVHNLIVLDFTLEIANMTAIEFLNDVILKRLGVIDIVVGYDNAFGKDRQGNLDFLREFSHQRGFGVTLVEPRNFYSRPVSSSWIRTELEDGNIVVANTLLGRRYALSGTIIHGVSRGKSMGFPTANIQVDHPEKVIPKDGVYAVTGMLEEDRYRGMLNIGTNPTFSNTERTIEVNLFDFNQDIYGGTVTVEFHERIRDEIRFKSAGELVEQLKRDKAATLKILGGE